MSKLEQILVIEPPNELSFTGPFTQAVSSIMTLRNPSERKICFKIKTTAPKKYCVKPNSGVIDPKETVSVTVSLQPFDFDPNEKNRHKFMVQSTYAPDGAINQDTLWKEADGKLLMDSKLKCVFIMPEDSNIAAYANGNEFSTAKSELPSNKATVTASPKASDDPNLRKGVEEIKKLQEEISALRQDNIQLKEESLRQKRLAAAAASSSNRQESSVPSEPFSVGTIQTEQNALSMAYLYAALVVLVLGIIIGKWVF